MKLGEYNELVIARETDIGLFLRDEENNEVLLPNRYVPERYELNQKLTVFLYNDSEGRLISTTLKPYATVNQLAYLQCRDITEAGAFFDIGIMKDILVPLKNQPFPLNAGTSYLIWIYLDTVTNRLVATANLERILSDQPHDLEPDDEIDLMIWTRKDHGWRLVVNEKYIGMIYHNQLFQPLEAGQRLKGYVNQIREDGRIDVLLQKPGVANIDASAQELLDVLVRNNGFLPLTDKSSPEAIASHLRMSKKSFKKAVGSLYKNRTIELADNGIRLKNK